MPLYTADFGPDYAAVEVGVTEYSAAGAVTVARTTSGITHIANGLFARDFTPNVGSAIVVWDADGVYASETIPVPSGLDAAGVRSALGMAAADLDTQLATLPTAAEIRTEIDSNSTKLDVATSTRLATSGYTAPDNAGIAAAVLSAAQTTPIQANIKKVNDITVTGSGTTPDPWGP